LNVFVIQVFAVSRKNRPDKAFAMKVISMTRFVPKDVEIGKLAKNCNFLVETKAAFASKVIHFMILFFIKN
jgi:hypothetical protein